MNNNELQVFTILGLDHPGSTDPSYRRRRDIIVDKANTFWEGGMDNAFSHGKVPHIEYLKREHATWTEVNMMLNEMLPTRACSMYLTARKQLDLPLHKIPQMSDINVALLKLRDFRLMPIAGLVNARAFLATLSKKVMLCTQYIRHHSRPTFTPEPDLIHEYLGHAPMFTDCDLVDFSVMVGRGALIANPEQLKQLERLYWYTLEYGMIEEKGKLKAFGAGLLAGIEDQNNAFKSDADIRPFTLEEVIRTDYDFANLQPKFFVLSSFEELKKSTKVLIERFEG